MELSGIPDLQNNDLHFNKISRRCAWTFENYWSNRQLKAFSNCNLQSIGRQLAKKNSRVKRKKKEVVLDNII